VLPPLRLVPWRKLSHMLPIPARMSLPRVTAYLGRLLLLWPPQIASAAESVRVPRVWKMQALGSWRVGVPLYVVAARKWS